MLSLGVDVYPDVLIHILRVVNFYKIASRSQTLEHREVTRILLFVLLTMI